MKITAEDKALSEKFPVKPSEYGRGLTQQAAKLSNDQIKRLLKLGLIKVVSRNGCTSLHDHNGFNRSGVSYCKV